MPFFFSGSCAFDYVKIFDNFTNEGQEIGTYCGKLSDYGGFGLKDIFSTGNAMHIEFVTASGRSEPTTPTYIRSDQLGENQVQRRGFRAEFEVSDKFAKLGQSSSSINDCDFYL